MSKVVIVYTSGVEHRFYPKSVTVTSWPWSRKVTMIGVPKDSPARGYCTVTILLGRNDSVIIKESEPELK